MANWILAETIQPVTMKALWHDGLNYSLWPELEGKIVWESPDQQYVAMMYMGKALYIHRFLVNKDVQTEKNKHYGVSQEDWDAYFADLYEKCHKGIIRCAKNAVTTETSKSIYHKGFHARYPVGDILTEIYHDDWNAIASAIDFGVIKDFVWNLIQNDTKYSYKAFYMNDNILDRYLPMVYKDGNVMFFDSVKILRMIPTKGTSCEKHKYNEWMSRYKYLMGYFRHFAKVGDSFDDILYNGLRMKLVLPQKDFPRPVILKTFAPKFERAIDSTQPKSSFDWIKVEISLNSSLMSRKEMFSYINKHKAKFDKEALKSIEESTKWKKYDIPINVLKVTDLVFRNDFMLEYTFALKNAV